MTFGGWLFLIGSWALITLLCVFCFARVLSLPAPPDEEDEEHPQRQPNLPPEG